MRYLALIALIDSLVLMLLGVIESGPSALAPLTLLWAWPAFFLVGVFIGIPGLWLVRRIAPGSLVALILIGILPVVVWGMVANRWSETYPYAFIFLAGLSAFLWWHFVERNPERRAYYD